MSPPAATLNLQTPKFFSHLLTSPFSLITTTTTINPRKLSPIQTLHFTQKCPKTRLKSSSPHSLHFSSEIQYDAVEDEDHVLGDCLVFEEGIFEDPFVQESLTPKEIDTNTPKNGSKSNSNSIEIETENLIPDNWLEAQKEINITKKERRKLALELQFGSKVEKRRQESRPIGNVSVEDYATYRDERLKQLKPVVLKNPVFFKTKVDVKKVEKYSDVKNDVNDDKSEEGSVSGVLSGRVVPRNPKLAVYGGGLEDITEFFNSGGYDPNAAKKSEGPRKLFTKEEKILLNRRIPDIAVATSGKWHPLHTLAASGEFYLLNSLLKHNIDINIPDKNGLTAIHKAILGKKQAIFNYLLRESANPFIRDKEGATLMHYAVRTASSHMIKILLLYNVDINLQDDDGWTPLHLAVQSQRTDVVRLLLIKGADKTTRNQDGLTPLDLCLHFSKEDTRTYELIKILKQLPRSRTNESDIEFSL